MSAHFNDQEWFVKMLAYEANMDYEKCLKEFRLVETILRRVAPEEERLNRLLHYLQPKYPVVFMCIKMIHSFDGNPKLSYMTVLNELERGNLCVTQFSNEWSYEELEARKAKYNLSKQPRCTEKVCTGNRLIIKLFQVHPKCWGKPKIFYSLYLQIGARCLKNVAYAVIAHSCRLFKEKWMRIPRISHIMIEYIGHGINHFDIFSLNFVMKQVFRPFVLNCPVEYGDALVPFMASFMPFGK